MSNLRPMSCCTWPSDSASGTADGCRPQSRRHRPLSELELARTATGRLQVKWGHRVCSYAVSWAPRQRAVREPREQPERPTEWALVQLRFVARRFLPTKRRPGRTTFSGCLEVPQCPALSIASHHWCAAETTESPLERRSLRDFRPPVQR